MIDKKMNEEAPTQRMEWIEPTVRQLDVQETANAIPERANDFSGSSTYPDCTRS